MASPNLTTMDRRRGMSLALAAAAVSGVAVFVNSYGVRAVPDATVYTMAKNLVAAAVLVALTSVVALARPQPARRPVDRQRLDRRHLTGLAAIAVIGGSVPFVLFFEGLARLSANQAAFIQKTLIIWVALLAVPLLGERLRALHVVAIAALVGGSALLGGGWPGLRFNTGAALVFAATLLWAVEVVVAKWLLRQVPATTVALTRMAGGVVLLTAWVAISGRWSKLAGLSATGWTWAALTGLILAGYVGLWFFALSLAPAVDVTAVLVLAALVTAVLNTVVKGTTVSAGVAAGCVILLGGVALILGSSTVDKVAVRS
jgi:drug/metabolite transporter (DMT)-like permease